jgi:hypothetical protein
MQNPGSDAGVFCLLFRRCQALMMISMLEADNVE